MSYIFAAHRRNRDPDSYFNLIRVRRAFDLCWPNGRVLDIGTAWGTVAHHAEREGAEVVGLDPDPDVRTYWDTTKSPSGRLITGTEVPDRFHVAYAIDVFEHMTDDEVRDVFEWLNAAYLVVYCPNRTSIFERAKKGHHSHVGMRTLPEMLALVPDGWRVVKAGHYGWRFFPWFNRRRWGVTVAAP